MSTASPDHARLIRQFELIVALDQREKDLLGTLPLRTAQINARQDIIREGDKPRESCLVLEGLIARYKMVAGGGRQILSFHFPGDMPDLQSLYLDSMDHALCTITPARIAYITHDALQSLSAHEPNIAAAFTKHALIDASIFREWIANIGRRPARARMAHLFCEFYVRARMSGIVQEGGMVLPLTQAELGDATGLSVVHVNRVLQELRKEGLISSRGKHHVVADWDGLKRAGDFDARYLHLRMPPDGLGL